MGGKQNPTAAHASGVGDHDVLWDAALPTSSPKP